MTNDTKQLFDAAKKSRWLFLFKELGFREGDIVAISDQLRNKNDEIPARYLERANGLIAEVGGDLLVEKFRWLVHEYTLYPYSREATAKLIVESLERGLEKYSEAGVELRYTTKINPESEMFGELLTINSFSQDDYGRLDIIEALLLLINNHVIGLLIFDTVRATDEFIEFRMVIGYEAHIGKNFLDSISMSSDEAEESSVVNKLRLNTTNPEPFLEYGVNKLALDSGSLEFFILNELFERFPNVAKDDDIIENWGGEDNQQTLYDASRRLNKKLSKILDAKVKPLHHKNSKYWFDEQFHSLIEPLTKTDTT